MQNPLKWTGELLGTRSHELGLFLGATSILATMVLSFTLLFRIGATAMPSERSAMANLVHPSKIAQIDRDFAALPHRTGALGAISDLDMPDILNLTKTYQSVDLFGRTFTKEEMCIAQAVYFEARGEPLIGQVAIAEVILNRIVDPRYPGTACKVVFQNQNRRHKCQFSFACDGLSDRPKNATAWEAALKVVALVMNGERSGIAKRATHYHAAYVNPKWSEHLQKLGQVGGHIFYREDTI
ncbi:MAG: hypothetical protein EP348_10940 [Alphaproteobacteria bacterium]|nr:MAG: hypothetical protein EP348_10940 [Alphaproteobacteria bacterium]